MGWRKKHENDGVGERSMQLMASMLVMWPYKGDMCDDFKSRLVKVSGNHREKNPIRRKLKQEQNNH